MRLRVWGLGGGFLSEFLGTVGVDSFGYYGSSRPSEFTCSVFYWCDEGFGVFLLPTWNYRFVGWGSISFRGFWRISWRTVNKEHLQGTY